MLTTHALLLLAASAGVSACTPLQAQSGFHEKPEWPRSFLLGLAFGEGGSISIGAGTVGIADAVLGGGGCSVTHEYLLP